MAKVVNVIIGFFQSPTGQILLLMCHPDFGGVIGGDFCGWIFADTQDPKLGEWGTIGGVVTGIIDALLMATAVEFPCPGTLRRILLPPRRRSSVRPSPEHSRHYVGGTAARLADGISSRYESLAIRISTRYVLLMIRSFKGKFAEPILQGRMVPKGFPANLAKVARRKLIMVDAATFLADQMVRATFVA